jgi:hypothetical protein
VVVHFGQQYLESAAHGGDFGVRRMPFTVTPMVTPCRACILKKDVSTMRALPHCKIKFLAEVGIFGFKGINTRRPLSA